MQIFFVLFIEISFFPGACLHPHSDAALF